MMQIKYKTYKKMDAFGKYWANRLGDSVCGDDFDAGWVARDELPCLWEYDGDYWVTSCGLGWDTSNPFGHIDDRITYCPSCGGQVEEIG